MKKNFIELINFILDKKTNKEKFIYSFKLIIYVIPMLFSLAKSQEELDTSTSQAGDDIYPIF